MCGSNTAFNMYPALTHGAAEVILDVRHAGAAGALRARRCSTARGPARCASPSRTPAATSARATHAARRKRADGSYDINGTKIFISRRRSRHDATNIVHLVLARTPDAPPGTKGLSLFIVPKLRTTPTASSASERRHRRRHRAQDGHQRLGDGALNFGENGDVHRRARRHGGAEGHAADVPADELRAHRRRHPGPRRVASTAYLNALDYAKERKQGSSIKHWKDATAPRVPIIEHADVRRMLLDMKARVEGIRALARQARACTTIARRALDGQGRRRRSRTTRARSICSCRWSRRTAADQAFRVCETAIQIYGGAGFTQATTPSSSTAATRRSSRSTRARTTSRRWTSSAAS